MFDLLPEAEKKNVRREYLFRFYGVAIWFVAAAAVLFTAFLLPAYFLSMEKYKVAKLNHEVIQKSLQIENGAALEEIAKSTNGQLEILKDLGESKAFHELARDIIFNKGGSIHLSNFTVRSLSVNEVSYKELSIRGVADDRTSLVAFSKMLEQFDEISKVELPVSNFTRETDIEFSIKAEGKF